MGAGDLIESDVAEEEEVEPGVAASLLKNCLYKYTPGNTHIYMYRVAQKRPIMFQD